MKKNVFFAVCNSLKENENYLFAGLYYNQLKNNRFRICILFREKEHLEIAFAEEFLIDINKDTAKRLCTEFCAEYIKNELLDNFYKDYLSFDEFMKICEFNKNEFIKGLK